MRVRWRPRPRSKFYNHLDRLKVAQTFGDWHTSVRDKRRAWRQILCSGASFGHSHAGALWQQGDNGQTNILLPIIAGGMETSSWLDPELTRTVDGLFSGYLIALRHLPLKYG